MERKIDILLIEDDPDDVELLQDALVRHGIIYQMHVINEGNAAIEYVRSCTEYPHIIILDYNLPKVHGREILKEIKTNSPLKEIPVLVLTTSSSPADCEFAYENGAAKFLVKPTTMDQIRETANVIAALASADR